MIYSIVVLRIEIMYNLYLLKIEIFYTITHDSLVHNLILYKNAKLIHNQKKITWIDSYAHTKII